MILAECKQLPEFPVMSKNNCVNSDKRHNKKNASVQQLDVDIVPPAFNFVTLFVK